MLIFPYHLFLKRDSFLLTLLLLSYMSLFELFICWGGGQLKTTLYICLEVLRAYYMECIPAGVDGGGYAPRAS